MSLVTRRWLALAATTAIVAGACSGAATQAPTAAGPSQAAASAAAPASAAISNVDITEHAYSPTPAANKGGTVVISDSQFPDLLLGYNTSSAEAWEAIYPAFDGLWRVANDFKIYPDLTKDVPTPQNGGVVVTAATGWTSTSTSRTGMKWSDGQPITCDDLIATWHWIMDKDQSGLVGGTDRLGGHHQHRRRHGTTSCVIHFNKVYEGYLLLVDPLLPAHYISTVPVTDAVTKLYPFDNISSGVYSGPYIPTRAQDQRPDHVRPEPQLADDRRARAVPRQADLQVLRRPGRADRRLQGRRVRPRLQLGPGHDPHGPGPG